MTNFEFVKKLDEQNNLKPMVAKGLISPHVVEWYEIAKERNEKILHGKKKYESIQEISIERKVSERKIYDALIFMSL